MDKELFDDAIGEVPASTVDVDAVITRGRRAVRLRRVANPAVAAGVAVVALVGLVAFTMTRQGGDGVRVGTPPASTTAPPSSSATSPNVDQATPVRPDRGTPPTACTRPDLETSAEVIARLDPVLTETFAAARPDVQYTAHPAAEYPAGVPHGALEFFQVGPEGDVSERPICDQVAYFLARATIGAPDGTGNVLIAVAPSFSAEPSMQCDNMGLGGEVKDCQEVVGPHGDHITLTSSQLEGGTSVNRIDVVRPDGTSVVVSAENIGSTGKSGGPPTSGQVALNFDQLTAIATDPRMTLFP